MSTEQKDTDQNALAAKLNGFWDNFKQGKIISYKLMALLLILVATVGSTWYILSERRKANSQRWMGLEEANTVTALEEISKNNPNTIQDRLARLEIARNQLGIAGIDQLGSFNSEQRKRAVENIEKARDSLGKLLDEFKDDPVFKAECLLGLAKAEAALVPVPAKEGQLTEFKGSIPKVVELLDQLAGAAAPGTPWATDSKKLADALRDPNSASAHEFLSVEQTLFKPPFGGLGSGTGTDPLMPGFPPSSGLGGFQKGSEPFIPGVPINPLSPAGLPKISEPKTPGASLGPIPPVAPSKGTDSPMPPGPMAPLPPGIPPKGTESITPKEQIGPIAPPPKNADPKTPSTPPPPMPKAPDPKAPSTPPPPMPKAPDPKAPVPPGPAPEKK